MYHALTPKTARRDAVLATVERALAAHELTLTLGLDELPALDPAVMASLIVGLRRMREAGGTLVLHVTKPELFGELSVSGLDRVFKIVAQPESSQPKPAPKRKRTGTARKIAGGLASIFGALLVLGGSHAAIGAVLERMK